jgi:hypothetical protein
VEPGPALNDARTSDGVTLAYQVLGQGPALVRLPGLDGGGIGAHASPIPLQTTVTESGSERGVNPADMITSPMATINRLERRGRVTFIDAQRD